jgi:hypothetical protein
VYAILYHKKVTSAASPLRADRLTCWCDAQELERLIDLHYLDPDAQRESGLTITDHRLLLGALQYKHKTCACWLRMQENAVVRCMCMRANPLDATDIVIYVSTECTRS